MTDEDTTELRAAIALLRERVAVLEHRANTPVRDGHPLWEPGTAKKPWDPPYVVTCEANP